MQKSESIKNISKALSDFQAEIKNPANTASNPFFKSKYAPLSEILSLVRPVLSRYKLSILQSPAGDGVNISITTILMHDSGEWIETDALLLKPEKTTPQAAGSAITYGRRYAISAVLGISSEDDDDGNASSLNAKAKTEVDIIQGKTAEVNITSENIDKSADRIKETVSNISITTAQRNRLFAIAESDNDVVRDVIRNFGYESTREIKRADYDKICNMVEDTAKKIKEAKELLFGQMASEPMKSQEAELPWDEKKVWMETIRT